MKSLKNLIVVMSFAFSLNAMASLKIESVVLNDGTSFEKAELFQTHLLSNKAVDYIELLDGSRIEGNDVKTVIYSNKFESKNQTTAASVRSSGGDGSGG